MGEQFRKLRTSIEKNNLDILNVIEGLNVSEVTEVILATMLNTEQYLKHYLVQMDEFVNLLFVS